MVCGHSFPCVYERTSFVYISLSRASVTFKDTRIINRMVRFRFKVAFSNTSVFEEPLIRAQFFPNSTTSGYFVHESQYGQRIIICFISYTVSQLYNFLCSRLHDFHTFPDSSDGLVYQCTLTSSAVVTRRLLRKKHVSGDSN